MFMAISGPRSSFDSLFILSGVNFIRLYAYYTLPGLNYVRLLKAHHVETTDVLFFEVVTAPLDEVRDQFVAILYCWDTAKPDRFLLLRDQIVVRVTANVKALLTQIFAGHDGELIWIDAICIYSSRSSI